MDEASRSNRPTPRTPAAIEAELRRRLRMDIAQARSDADGELDDGTLAEVIARAIAAALSWHLEGPEHTRNATISSRTWKPAGGPRGGGGPPPRDFPGPPPRERDFDEPRRGPYPPRNYDERPRRPDFDEPFRDDDFRPPPRPRSGPGGRPPPSGPRPGPRPGGRRPPTGRGGFGPRKPRRNG
jgi:hypothetical protein